MKKKILLSYFAPFGSLGTNSSEEVAKAIEAENVDKIRLEVKYQKDFKTLRNAFFASNYDLVIMLGQARGRDKISLEKRATNLNNPKAKDNDNFFPNEEIMEDGDHYLYTKIDLDDLIAKINSEFVLISKNAGSFLCNFVYYQALFEFDKPSLFVHLPTFDTQGDDERIPTMKLEDEIKEIRKIIDILSEDRAND